MEFTNIFKLLKSEAIELKKQSINLTIFTILILLVLSYKLNQYPALNELKSPLIFGGWVFLMGSYFSATLFWQFKTPYTKQTYLCLPASSFEKLIAKFIIIGPIFIISSFVVLYLFDLISALLLPHTQIGNSETIHIFGIANYHIKDILLQFLQFHAIFVLGSAYFEKRALMKTSIVIILYKIGFFILLLMIARISNPEEFSTTFSLSSNLSHLNSVQLYPKVTDFMDSYLIPMLCWIATYLVLKNKRG